MSATDELRRLLDERGVEYEGGERSLRWRDRYGIMMQAFPLANGELGMGVWSCTPEQAIDATLGRGTCHAVFEVDAMSEDERIGEFVCSECGETFGDGRDQMPRYCPNCGRAVVND